MNLIIFLSNKTLKDIAKLVVPIDRKYTLNYFYGHSNIPKKLENKKFNLKKYCKGTWNLCETKVLDNMVIGYEKSKEKSNNQINRREQNARKKTGKTTVKKGGKKISKTKRK